MIKKFKKMKRYIPLLLMTLPGMLYLLLNNYLPLAGIIIAFKNINYQKGIFGSDWVGLKNFVYLFRTTDAFIITRNTILYNVGFIVINTLVAITVAILLNEIKKRILANFYQTIILLPYLISMVIVSYLAFAMLSDDTGFLNKTILPALGVSPVSWYNEPSCWPIILNLINVWKGFGFLSIIYLSSIVGIDTQYYEAAELDGASKWQKVIRITIPSISPVIAMMVLLSVGKIFYSDFGLFYQIPMNSGTLYNTTNVIDTYVYRGLMQLGDIGMSSAAGLYQSFVGFILVVFSNFIINKINPENALY